MYILKHWIPVNYADDNTFCAKGETLWEALERVRQDTEAAIYWFDNNKMQANPITFQYMHTSKTEDIVFECKDIQIQPDEIVKHLGIHIDELKNQVNYLSFIYSGQLQLLPTDLDQ